MGISTTKSGQPAYRRNRRPEVRLWATLALWRFLAALGMAIAALLLPSSTASGAPLPATGLTAPIAWYTAFRLILPATSWRYKDLERAKYAQDIRQ